VYRCVGWLGWRRGLAGLAAWAGGVGWLGWWRGLAWAGVGWLRQVAKPPKEQMGNKYSPSPLKNKWGTSIRLVANMQHNSP
jgi:hypothetical protein